LSFSINFQQKCQTLDAHLIPCLIKVPNGKSCKANVADSFAISEGEKMNLAGISGSLETPGKCSLFKILPTQASPHLNENKKEVEQKKCIFEEENFILKKTLVENPTQQV
jgi:ABC-type microcin C transport system duplicated ATPase subunit YejF